MFTRSTLSKYTVKVSKILLNSYLLVIPWYAAAAVRLVSRFRYCIHVVSKEEEFSI